MAASNEEIRKHWLNFHRDVEVLGESLRTQKLPQYEDGMFLLYEQTGNRLIYETIYFERRKFLVTFGLLSLWYKKDADLKKLAEIIEEICSETTWALPAHVSRSTKNWKKTVDLFACETGQTLAQLIYMLKSNLPEKLVEQVKELVISRLLDSYLEIPEGQWRWEAFQNNWVAVCCGCLGSMALYLLSDAPQTQNKILDRVCRLLPEYLMGMCADGTCPEGLSYYTYGLVYYIGFSRQLMEAGISRPMMDSEKFQQIATFQQKCYFPGGNTVSFSDGSSRERYRLGMTCYLAERYPDVEIPEITSTMSFFDDRCYRFMANYQDALWVSEYLKHRLENEKSYPPKEKEGTHFYILEDAQWAVWQSDLVSAAIKGGHNDEPHNHNDIGSFVYFANGECFLTDLGCGEYTKEYFDPDTRYHFLCNRSWGHSVPVAAHMEQGTGKEFAAEQFHADEYGKVSIHFAKAYPPGTLESLERQFYRKNEHVMVLEDRARIICEGSTITEHLITQIKPQVTDRGILLQGKRGALQIDVTKGWNSFVLSEESFCNHRGVNETVWIIQWDVPKEKYIAGTAVTFCYHPTESDLFPADFQNHNEEKEETICRQKKH